MKKKFRLAGLNEDQVTYAIILLAMGRTFDQAIEESLNYILEEI